MISRTPMIATDRAVSFARRETLLQPAASFEFNGLNLLGRLKHVTVPALGEQNRFAG